MALNDVVFIEGDKQNFIVEVPAASYSGSVVDIVSEASTNSGRMIENIPISPPTRAEVIYVS
jgi:hypothetical protein